jgi:hypothetical protein
MSVLRKVKGLLVGAGAMAVLSAVACVQIYSHPDVEEVSKQAATIVATPVKAHLTDGSTVVFRNGASIGGGYVRGIGERFGLEGAAIASIDKVPLDSVVGMERFFDKIDPVPTVAGSYFATVAAGAAVVGLAIAIFGSCPTFYADSAGTPVLQAEAFSYSIAPLFEQRGVHRLSASAGADGIYSIEMRNEALETHFINQLELLEVERSPGERVVPDEHGIPINLRVLRPVSSARDRAGRDVAPALSASDGRLFASDSRTLAAAKPGDLDDYIDVVVPRPISGDSVALFLRLRNSLLNTVLLYDGMLAGQGARSLDWLGKDLDKISGAIELGRWYTSRMGMRVSVMENGKWRPVTRFIDKGPIAFYEIGITVPAPAGDSVRIRFSFAVDDWRIDQIAVAAGYRRAAVRIIPAMAVTRGDALRDSAALRDVLNPDDRYLVTHPGEKVTIKFDTGRPGGDSTRTFLLGAQGYYSEWVRGAWLKDSHQAKPFALSDATLVEAIRRWRAKQKSFEREFYSTRLPVR